MNLPAKSANSIIESFRGEDTVPNASYLILRAKYEGTKIAEMEYESCLERLYEILHKAIMDMGHYKISENATVLKHIVKGIVQLIAVKKRFRDLTIELFEIIIHKGSKGEYKRPGELDSISVNYIERWIDDFLDSEQHKQIIEAYIEKSKEPIPKRIYTKEEIDRIYILCAANGWHEFKESGTVANAIVHCYTYLKKTFKFTFTSEEYEAIEARVREKLFDELKEKEDSFSIKMKEAKAIRDLIAKGEGKEFEFECRREALLLFFLKVKQMGHDLYIKS